ncbi:sporadically distributed protein, TIGR04141 family [Variovorax sp. YR750]|uniref:TIGR04141 family sporadically distributed protein n=1 Tax=Variovorax sp. YR750 TaxID=1884384 RepID=UPI0008AC1117|nr:TIGR04141 family sporadically distributed protein [Variovorax sp. YR750]SEL86280.1 sporadically distributed protein, TIGR04141 family [Variovorax sp. YR750]
MAGADDAVRLGVSVYLLKRSKTAEAQRQLEDASDTVYPLVDSIPGAAFIALPADAGSPKWLRPVSTLLADGAAPQLEGQSPGALLWVPRGEKIFVFTFGYGHSKVKEEWVEPDFGKVLALALVPQGQVREMRAEQVFAKRHIASERAPRASAVREFGFEPDRDLVAAVEGVPESKYWPVFGTKVRGGVSFKFDLEVAKLIETLDQIAERFDSNDHRSRWPQANNLVAVRDDEKLEKLDALLDRILTGRRPENAISLAAPGERSGEGAYPQHFVIGRRTKSAATSPYLMFGSWQKYVQSKDGALGLAAAKATPVHLLDGDKEEIGVCSMYQCMGAEVSLEGVTHVLSSGSWYSPDRRFIASTNQTLAMLGAPSFALKAWNTIDHEGPYNEDAANSDPDLWLFDKELVSFGGGASRFEFCDIMHLPTKTLYFVKHPAGSAGVSHLCEQVRRTAELFFDTDPSYRQRLADRITAVGKGWNTNWLTTRPKQHEWNLCLVLMGKQVSALPFFAKCGIARLLGELQKRGFDVSFQAV